MKNFFLSVNTLSGKIDNQKNNTLKNVFESLKTQAETTPGKIIAEILDALKDKILELVGASVALFDISRYARDLRKYSEIMPADQISQFCERIDNWSVRLVKSS